VFGESARLDFSLNGVVSSETSSSIWIPYGCSSICDINGNLIAVCQGDSIFDQNFVSILEDTTLSGTKWLTQTSLIIPMPGNQSRYYVISMDKYIPQFYYFGITYSILDFDSAGKIKVISLNNSLLINNTTKVSAVKHENGIDYWIILHGFGEETGRNFYSFLLTESGLSTEPVITTIGHPHDGDYNNVFGQMKISPDGTKLALVLPADGIVEIYDFNTQSGILSNAISSELNQFNWALGLEFSPNANYLYISISPNGSGQCVVYQLDLQSTSPFSLPYSVHQFEYKENISDSVLASMQLAIDGRIYIAKKAFASPKNNLDVIFNPDRDKEHCNYNRFNDTYDYGINLNGGGSLLGLPNFVSSFLNVPDIIAETNNIFDTTVFHIRNQANIDSVMWTFTSNREYIESRSFTPKILFSNPGNVNVELRTYFEGRMYQFSDSIEITNINSEVENNINDRLLFYPNPASANITLSKPNYSLQLHSLQGQLILKSSSGEKQISLEGVATGVYVATILEGEKVIGWEKLIVN
jgi:WD40 repeat protein